MSDRKLVQRLTEAVSTAKPVIIKERVEHFWVCPHCQKEIYEKHTYTDESGTEHHSDYKTS